MQTWFNRKTGKTQKAEHSPGNGWMWIGPSVRGLRLSALHSGVTGFWEPVMYKEKGTVTFEDHLDRLTKRIYVSQTIRSEKSVGRAMKDTAFLTKELTKAMVSGDRLFNLDLLLQYLPQKDRDYITAQMLVRGENGKEKEKP